MKFSIELNFAQPSRGGEFCPGVGDVGRNQNAFSHLLSKSNQPAAHTREQWYLAPQPDCLLLCSILSRQSIFVLTELKGMVPICVAYAGEGSPLRGVVGGCRLRPGGTIPWNPPSFGGW